MSNIIIQGNEINAKKYVEKITIEGVGEEKTLNPRMIVAKGGNSMINYSTEEQVIGTWIDEKPLYQKVISKNNISTRSEFTVIDSSIEPNIKIIDFNGYFIDPWGSLFDFKAYYDTENYRTYAYLKGNQTMLVAYCSFGSTVYNNVSLIVVLNYTKTTD